MLDIGVAAYFVERIKQRPGYTIPHGNRGWYRLDVGVAGSSPVSPVFHHHAEIGNVFLVDELLELSRRRARQGALRAAPRASLPARRFISTAPPAQKSRSWKSLVARLGLAGAIIYYYNTTDVFADEPRRMPRITAHAAVNGC